MSGEADPAALTVEDVLSGLFESGEQRVIVPKKGKLFAEDGTCKVSVIRPCVSRGRRLRGLPPIYTPEMLGENARIFSGWPMFVDHKIQEAALEIAKRTGRLAERSVWELGGRIVESWWDPELVLPDDEEYGYRRGGVVARALPQKAIREMVETDPDILHCSINAWPTGAKPGERWGQKGMLVEGIRRKPPGSVDWVIRGGAGGRILQEDEDLAVSLLESFYDAATPETEKMSDLDYSTLNLQELETHLQQKAPRVFQQLQEAKAPASPAGGPPITLADVQRLLEEQENRLTTSFEETLAEREEDLEKRANDRVDELLQERDTARGFATVARDVINGEKGLTPRWRADLLAQYSMLPSGPSPALLVEAEGDKDAEAVLREKLQEDVQHALDSIAEARGGPAVRGLGRTSLQEADGGSGGGKGTETGKRKVDKRNAFNGFLSESGDNLDKLVNGEKVEG